MLNVLRVLSINEVAANDRSESFHVTYEVEQAAVEVCFMADVVAEPKLRKVNRRGLSNEPERVCR